MLKNIKLHLNYQLD